MDMIIQTLAGPMVPLLAQDGATGSYPTVALQNNNPTRQTQAVAGAAVLSGGTIASIPVRMGGSGYTAAPTVTISGGGGSSGTATTTLDAVGGVKSINVTAAGTGYTSAPIVKISASAATGITNALDISGGNGRTVFNYGEFIFFAQGLNSGTFNVKIVGWKQAVFSGTPGQWIPRTLADLLCTVGATTGATGSLTPPLASHNLATTIAINSSIIVPNYDLWVSDGGIAVIRLDLSGSQAISLIPGTQASGTVTAMNGLMSGL